MLTTLGDGAKGHEFETLRSPKVDADLLSSGYWENEKWLMSAKCQIGALRDELSESLREIPGFWAE